MKRRMLILLSALLLTACTALVAPAEAPIPTPTPHHRSAERHGYAHATTYSHPHTGADRPSTGRRHCS